MTSDQERVIRECAAQAVAGTASFAEIVQRFIAIGVERYHADYTRMETTYYLAGGGSAVVPIDLPSSPIGNGFQASIVESSVRQSQRGEIKYPQFVKQSTAAGCVGYFVLLTGQCVQYFGRDGDMHTEWFPGARRKP